MAEPRSQPVPVRRVDGSAVTVAVMHYQFEATHPFIDGNGRTGRVLNLLYLVDNRRAWERGGY